MFYFVVSFYRNRELAAVWHYDAVRLQKCDMIEIYRITSVYEYKSPAGFFNEWWNVYPGVDFSREAANLAIATVWRSVKYVVSWNESGAVVGVRDDHSVGRTVLLVQRRTSRDHRWIKRIPVDRLGHAVRLGYADVLELSSPSPESSHMNTQYCFMYTMSSESEMGESVYFPMTVHALPQFCAIMNILSVSVLLIMPLIAVGMKLHTCCWPWIIEWLRASVRLKSSSMYFSSRLVSCCQNCSSIAWVRSIASAVFSLVKFWSAFL